MMTVSLQPMPTFLHGQFDGKMVANVIITFRRDELSGEEGTWIES